MTHLFDAPNENRPRRQVNNGDVVCKFNIMQMCSSSSDLLKLLYTKSRCVSLNNKVIYM